MRSEVALVAAALVIVGCDSGPANAQAGCMAIAHAWCHRIWELSSQGCVDAAGIAASFANEQQCEDDFEYNAVDGRQACSKVSCSPKGYSPSNASSCASAAGSIECSPDIALAGYSCPGICCELEGSSVGFATECCSGSAHETAAFNCGPSFSVPPSLICD